MFGVVTSMVGVFAGGYAVARFGLMPSLADRRVRRAAEQPDLHLARDPGPQPHRALFVAIGVDNVAGRFLGHVPDRLHVEPHVGRLHGDPVRAVLLALRACRAELIASQSGRIVEGAARLADTGGVLTGVKGFFATSAPENFATAIERSGVSPAALGTGYVVSSCTRRSSACSRWCFRSRCCGARRTTCSCLAGRRGGAAGSLRHRRNAASPWRRGEHRRSRTVKVRAAFEKSPTPRGAARALTARGVVGRLHPALPARCSRFASRAVVAGSTSRSSASAT